MTVASWAARWQKLYPGRRNAETTAHNAQMVAPFARAHGYRRLEEVTPLIAQAWAVRSPGTVRYLRLMFSKAVKAGLLDANVWERVEVTQATRHRLPPTPAQLERLVAQARARGGWWDSFADLLVFTAHTGLRLAEVADVQAQDVLDSGSRLLVRGKRRPGERTPRMRTVAVLEPARSALAAHAGEGRVWSSKTGRPLTKHSAGRAYRDLCDATGIEGSFHGLRHFCATWLLDKGASEQDVAIQLGHVDEAGHVDVTQVRRRYGHPSVQPALQRLEAVAGGV